MTGPIPGENRAANANIDMGRPRSLVSEKPRILSSVLTSASSDDRGKHAPQISATVPPTITTPVEPTAPWMKRAMITV